MSLYFPKQNNDPASAATAVLFLDRDGVIIKDCNYLSDPESVELLPGVGDALVRAVKAGFKLVIISNQSGIGRGYFSEDDLLKVQLRLDELLAEFGVVVEVVAYCPHAPADNCNCRKPMTGLVDELSEVLSWSPKQSFMVGDKVSDVELGSNMGVESWFVLTGHNSEPDKNLISKLGAQIAIDLSAVVAEIVSKEG
ncbi:HAD family hydrolase [bacterium]|jgi:D-glycero-D-manno-heptose 1,7-bisphosphate phosphatase|nr:HAD family hydrolase [bacterium]MBT7310529.1 HAD family hydrolase [bacterium]